MPAIPPGEYDDLKMGSFQRRHFTLVSEIHVPF